MAGPEPRHSVEELAQALYEASDPGGTPWVRRGRIVREPWLQLARDRIVRSENSLQPANSREPADQSWPDGKAAP